MPHTTRKPTRWGKVRGWHSHSMACWDAEWASYCQAASEAGKSTNGWIRDSLKEMVRYERVARDDERVARDDGGPDSGVPDPQ